MNKKRLAKLLSVILGPQLWLPILLITATLKSNLSSQQFFIIFPLMLIFQFLIPVGYLYIAAHKGTVSAWDLPKREERYHFFGITFISYLLSIIFIYLLGNHFLLNLSLIILALLIILSLTTFFWKISIHTSLNTAGSILLNYLFNWQLPWLYLSIPLIFWARLELKRHTLLQLLAGILVSAAVCLMALFYYLS